MLKKIFKVICGYCGYSKSYGGNKKPVEIKFYSLTDIENNTCYIPYDEKNKKLFQQVYLNKRCYIKNAKNENKKEMWKEYYNWYNLYNAPLKYCYSTTIHKSQGSGYNNVFLDMRSIFTTIPEHKELKYVGVSRTINNLEILL